jgi:DNA (cytosine-5)-methyltransferase 1
MHWHPSSRRKTREEIAGTLGAGPSGGWASDVERMTFLPVPFDPTQITHKDNRSNPLPGDHAGSLAAQAKPPHIIQAVAFKPAHFTRGKDGAPSSVYPTLTADADKGDQDPVIAHTLTCHAAKGGDPSTDNYTVQNMRVRRLTPRECERLQGFPDDYTLIPGASDSARYKACGNSMAVPVMRRLGHRIEAVDSIG